MPNRRIRKKYQKFFNELAKRDANQPINHRQCRYIINTYSQHAYQKADFILHADDLDDGFKNHAPNGKYHAEDCNRNNPNNPASLRYPNRQSKTYHWHHK